MCWGQRAKWYLLLAALCVPRAVCTRWGSCSALLADMPTGTACKFFSVNFPGSLSSHILPPPHMRYHSVSAWVQIALEAVSAVHQLTSAFHTLSLCLRPLLTAGFPLAAASEGGMVIDESIGNGANPLIPEQVCGIGSLSRVNY